MKLLEWTLKKETKQKQALAKQNEKKYRKAVKKLLVTLKSKNAARGKEQSVGFLHSLGSLLLFAAGLCMSALIQLINS